MNEEKIKQKLALQIAQLNYDKVVLEVQNEELKAKISQLENEVKDETI